MSEDRLESIEFKLAHQEDLLNQLNDLVTRQHLEIDKLKTTCISLSDQLKRVQQSGDAPPSEAEIPPHY